VRYYNLQTVSKKRITLKQNYHNKFEEGMKVVIAILIGGYEYFYYVVFIAV
jgi:hypothetical protein